MRALLVRRAWRWLRGLVLIAAGFLAAFTSAVLIAVYAVLGLTSILVVRALESRLLVWRRAYDGD